MMKGKWLSVFPMVFAGLTMLTTASPVVAASAEMQIVMPATASDILEAIDEESTELEDIIKHNQFSEVHHHALVIRDLANGLMTHAEGLSAQQLIQLKENIKAASVIVQHLDVSGRAKDKTETAENFSKLQKSLSDIKRQYEH